MMRRRNLWCLALLVSLLLTASLPATGAAVDAAPVRVIVTFRDRVPAGLEAELTSMGATGAMAFPSIDSVAFAAPRSTAELFAADPRVLQVRPQRRLEFTLHASVEQINGQGVETPETYAVGRRTYARPGVSGAGQTVAVIDTGIWGGHPDLLGKVSKSLNFELQYTYAPVFAPEQRDVAFLGTGPLSNVDTWGHGTHVAGIIGGTGAMAAGRENHGVAPGAQLVSLKIGDVWNGFPQDAGWETNALAAIDWILRHHDDAEFGPHGIQVVNNSWSLMPEDFIFGPVVYDPMKALIQQVVAEDVTMVFAAGNSGPNSVVPVPNGMDEVISVGNACKVVDSCGEGNIAGDSSTGPAVDIAAPGSNIISTYLPPSLVGAIKPFSGGSYGSTTEEEAQNNAFYTAASGTSMAAPHIAGVIALMLEIDPTLTPSQIRDLLMSTATDKGPAGQDDAWGAGLVNVREVLRAVHQRTVAPIGPPAPSPCKRGKQPWCRG